MYGYGYKYMASGPIGSNVNQPPVISDIVISLITDTTFRVTCTIDPGSSPVTPVLHYGETVSYGSTVNGSEISEAGSVMFNVTGLTAFTDYRIKVVAGETELSYGSVIQTAETAPVNILRFGTNLNAIDWGSNQTMAQDWTIEFRYDCKNDITAWMPLCSSTGAFYLLFDDDRRFKIRIAGSTTDLTSTTGISREWAVYRNGMIEWKFAKVGTTLTISINRDVLFTATIPDTAFQFRYFGRWSTNNAYDAVGDLEWIKLDGVTYDAANSWGGRTLTGLTATTADYKPHYRSFIVAGQSNAVSRNAAAANAFTGITFPIANSVFWRTSDSSFQDTIHAENATGVNQGADYTGNWGVEMRIADNLSKENKPHQIVKYAVGGTSMSVWGPWGGVTNNYTYRLCQMAALSGREYKNFIYIQGEADAANEALSLAYEANLRALIKVARQMLTNGFNTRIIIVRLNTFPDAAQLYEANVQAAQDAVAASVANVKIVTPSPSSGLLDDTHYNAASIDTIAEQVYAEMIK